MTISATTAAMMNQYGAPPNSRRRNAGLPSWCRELRLLDMFGKVVAAGYRSALRVLPRREIRVRAGVAGRRLPGGPSRIQLLRHSAASAKANPRQARSRTPAGSESALAGARPGSPGAPSRSAPTLPVPHPCRPDDPREFTFRNSVTSARNRGRPTAPRSKLETWLS